MKKRLGDYVAETIQALIVGGSLTALSYAIYKKTLKDMFAA